MSKKNILTMFVIAGAFVSYTVGAGFASGNEVFQFFGSWGFPESLLAIVGGAVVTFTYCYCLYYMGQRVEFEKTTDAYEFVGGKFLGKFYYIVVFVWILASLMIMFTGAGSLLEQCFGLPQWVGSVTMGIIAAIVVLGGFKTVEQVLGYVGIALIVYVFIFAIVSLLHPAAGLEQADGINQAVEDGLVWQANFFELFPLSLIPGLGAINGPLVEGILYGALCVMTGFPFYITLGKKTKSHNESTAAAVTTTMGFYICIIGVLVILLTNFNSLVNTETNEMFPFPVIAAIDSMWPSGSWTYAIMIFLGIFTSAAGYIWVLTDWIFPGQEKTKKSSILIIVLIVCGIVLGGVLPFSELVNILYPFTGFIGLIMTISILIKTIKLKRTKE